MNTLRRTIHPETHILNKQGLVEYVASDETVDSYHEIIKASGWRFNHFAKNAPFVDSHDYFTIQHLLGQVTDFRVEGDKLIERVQWAMDVPENHLAQLGWKMTEAGYLRAVSVGFRPTKYVARGQEQWTETLTGMGLSTDSPLRAIYLEQEQLELSSVVLGANPNALARSGVLTQQDLDTFVALRDATSLGDLHAGPAAHAPHSGPTDRQAFLAKFRALLKR